MLRRPVVLLTVLTLSACSCVSDSTYTTCIVEITPTPTGLERQLTLYRTHVADTVRTRVPLRLDRAAADRLERIYGTRPMTAHPESVRTVADVANADTTAPYVARGSFTSIPNDLGNWGSLRSLASPLGSSWIYMERIGGDPEPAARLQRRFTAVDSLTDILLGWSESELGGHPRWPLLRSEIDVDLRRMLQNLVLDGVREDSAQFNRFMLAVFEQPLSFMPLAVEPPGEGSADAVYERMALKELRTHMAGTLGLRSAAEVDRVLRYVSHPDSARRSFARYLAGTMGDSVAAGMRPWTRIVEATSGEDESASGSNDSLAVRLVLPSGSLDVDSNAGSDSGLVPTWHGWIQGLPSPSTGLPFVCWATWVRPDSAAQLRLFGEVDLEEDELSDYCLWFDTLDARQKAEWNRMLMRLRPGKLKRLERFRFSDTKRGEEPEIPGRDILLRAFGD